MAVLTFVLGIVVGLLAGWFIWGRVAAHDHHDHGAHTHDGKSHGGRDHGGRVDKPDEAEALTPTPFIDSGDAIAPTGVPHVVDNRIDVPIDNEPLTAEAREADETRHPRVAEAKAAAPVKTGAAKATDVKATETGTKPAKTASATKAPAKTAPARSTATATVPPKPTEAAKATASPNEGGGPRIPKAAEARAREIGITPPETGKNGDDLKLVNGIGPKLEEMLQGLGVYTFAQMAGWTEEEIDRVDENLTAFKGRIRRDDWRAQARDLRR